MRPALVVVLLAGCGRIGFALSGAGHDAAGDGAGDIAADAPPPPPSCAVLPATCGPAGNTPCCDSPMVAGGTFYRSYDVATDGMYASMGFPATVSTFRHDRYEVTVGRFREFVNAGMGTQANPPAAGAGARMLNGAANQGGWDPAWNANLVADAAALVAAVKCNSTYQTWTDAPGAGEHRPIVCITWYEAMAFCVWDGGFLPTEAEAMYSAGGGSEQRAYPWSSPAPSITIDCTLANFGGASWPATACQAAGASDVGSLSPAGDGVWGQADLGGNVWEWGLDWRATPLVTPCTDCANLVPAMYRTLHGGSYDDLASTERSAGRDFTVLPSSRDNTGGVRCARSP